MVHIKKIFKKNAKTGNSLVVQWLGLHAFTAEGPGSILVGELRSHKLHGAAKKKKKGQNNYNTGVPHFISLHRYCIF